MTKHYLPPYVREHLKHLDNDLRGYGGQYRIHALENYQIGLEQALHESYPKKFAAPKEVAHEGYFLLLMDGIHFGRQIGPQEVEYVRQTLLTEIEKRKKSTTLVQKITGILNGLGQFRSEAWLRDFGPKFGG